VAADFAAAVFFAGTIFPNLTPNHPIAMWLFRLSVVGNSIRLRLQQPLSFALSFRPVTVIPVRPQRYGWRIQ
jgi:hypothetical protein